jgi:O-antigen/teichoic acid export membrane protein
VIFLGTVVGRLLGLLGQVLIVRALSPVVFGHVALAHTVVLIVARVAQAGVPQGAARFLSADEETENSYEIIRSSFGLILIGVVISSTVLYLSRYRLSTLLNDEQLPFYLTVLLPFVILFPLSRLSISILQAKELPKITVVIRDIFPYLGALSVFLSLSWIGVPAIGAVSYWLTVPLAVIAVTAVYGVQNDWFPSTLARPDGGTTRDILSFSWPLAFESSFMLLLSNLDILMIGFFLSSQEVGWYRSVQPLRQSVIFVLTSVVFVYLPIATQYYERGDLAGLERLYRISTKWVVSATLPVVLVLALFSESIITTLFRQAYVPATPALSALAVGMFFRVAAGPTGTTLKAVNKPRVELVAAFIGLVSNILCNLVLIPTYGIFGAAVATGVGFTMFNLVELVVIYSRLDMFPYSLDTVKPILPTVVAMLLLRHQMGSAGHSLLELAFFGIFAVLIHVVSLFVTRSIDETDIETVKTVL